MSRFVIANELLKLAKEMLAGDEVFKGSDRDPWLLRCQRSGFFPNPHRGLPKKQS
jgi:hypothetical protein